MRGGRFEKFAKRHLHVAEKPARADDYNDLKRRWGVTISAYAKRAGLSEHAARFDWPVLLSFYWYEPDRMRDPDGVDSGGRKLILDALCRCTARCLPGCALHAGVMPSDGAAHVAGFRRPEFRYLGPAYTGVSVAFFHRCSERLLAPPLVVPARLPDLNELFEARELGARRSVSRGKNAR
jgi:hypothetical protein